MARLRGQLAAANLINQKSEANQGTHLLWVVPPWMLLLVVYVFATDQRGAIHVPVFVILVAAR